MKILIEDVQTKEYLTKSGNWTKNSRDAATYPSSFSAKQFATKAPIGRFNIVGFFSNSPQLTNLDEGCGCAPSK